MLFSLLQKTYKFTLIHIFLRKFSFYLLYQFHEMVQILKCCIFDIAIYFSKTLIEVF